MIAFHSGQTLDMATVSLTAYLQSKPVNAGCLSKDIQENIAFLHAKGLSVGREHLDSDKILVVESTEGPNAILTIQEHNSSFKEDIVAAGELFRLILTSGSRAIDFLEFYLISKMTREDATMMTASKEFDSYVS